MALGGASLGSCEAAPTAAFEPCETTFCVALPVDANDTAFAALGIWPFGVHGSSHALDGHPGWDIEFRIGSSALAADAGTVQSLFVDAAGGVTTAQVSHTWRGKQYRTVYTNLNAVAAGLTVGAAVTRGQPLGVPKAETRTIGTRTVTYAMIHFQFDDFSSMAGLTNVNAVSPETHLLPDARVLFAAIWRKAAYIQELCEPFATNPRDAAFPLTRRWTSSGGQPTSVLDVTCDDPATNAIRFALTAGGTGSPGTLLVNPVPGGASEIDLTSSGVVTRGLFRVIGDTLELALAAPGAARPPSLSNVLRYLTAK